MPEHYKKGPADTPPGQGEQLPQGEATRLNKALEAMPHEDEMLAPPVERQGGSLPPQGVKFAAGDGDGADTEALSEDQDILWGDQTQHPSFNKDMVLQSSARRHSDSIPIPTKLLRLLPYLKQAADDPSAPESVRAFYRATVISIESRLRNSGR